MLPQFGLWVDRCCLKANSSIGMSNRCHKSSTAER